HQRGYVEGRNLLIEYRWADTQLEKLPALAAELVRMNVKAVVAVGLAVLITRTVQATGTRIPIVFFTGSDPVRQGLVASLNHPGGNVTGVTGLFSELGTKHIGLLNELVPNARVIATLIDPTSFATNEVKEQMRTAETVLGKPIKLLEASKDSEIDA